MTQEQLWHVRVEGKGVDNDTEVCVICELCGWVQWLHLGDEDPPPTLANLIDAAEPHMESAHPEVH